jgi:hypothetical protein
MGIKMKRSAVAGKVPLITDLELGEIGVNTNDGRMFIKKSVAGVESVVGVGDPTVGATFTAGTNAQGQGAITTDVVIITTAAANPSGVTLPAAVAGSKRVIVANRAANPVNVYPVSGSAIDGLSTNTPLQIATNGIVEFVAVTATLWLSSPGLAFLLGRSNAFTASQTITNQSVITGFNGLIDLTQWNAAAGAQTSRLSAFQNAANRCGFEVANQANTKGTLLLQPFGGDVVVGNATATNPGYGGGIGFRFQNGGAFSNAVTGSGDSAFQQRDASGAFFNFWFGNLNSVPAAVGSITTNGTGVTYATTSDYRAKENFQPISNAIARLNSLPVYRFNFKSEPGRVVDGFIAHEAAAVVPEAVIGAKDAVDADGNPILQGIDQAKLLPLAWAALQEAVAKIATLEARIEALESAAP